MAYSDWTHCIWAEGKFIAIVAAEDAERALSALKATAGGENAAIIGYLRPEKGVAVKTQLGGTRVLGPLCGEGLPRIC